MLIAFEGFPFKEGGVCAAKGFKANGVHCGLRKASDAPDLAMLYSDAPCAAAAVYTTNKVKGAPIAVTKAHIASGTAQAVIVNSGNANTCNIDGEEKAEEMCRLAAEALHIDASDIAVASTGVIGEILPIEPIAAAVPALAEGLSETGNEQAARAIMTTDTVKKEVAVTFALDGKEVTIGGMAKGSGMIHPNMATMLCFLTTDAAIEQPLLQLALSAVVKDTFNMVSVDGDTSTNDTVLLLSSGKAGNAKIEKIESADYQTFVNALYVILMNLSRMIAKDGEGASKLLECTVTGAVNEQTAKTVAKSVITSSLFKCAMFGKDPNWGRILCAVGYAQAELDPDAVSVSLSSSGGTVCVCENGRGVSIDKEKAAAVLSPDEVKILISLGDGEGRAVAWGCDLTYDYVKINADYHT